MRRRSQRDRREYRRCHWGSWKRKLSDLVSDLLHLHRRHCCCFEYSLEIKQSFQTRLCCSVERCGSEFALGRDNQIFYILM